jgi:hypothetical protein
MGRDDTEYQTFASEGTGTTDDLEDMGIIHDPDSWPIIRYNDDGEQTDPARFIIHWRRTQEETD